MDEQEIYGRALEYATKKHDGQKRQGGEPYIVHPVAVSLDLKRQGLPLDYQITGLFHDLLEDTDATEDEILALSNERVLKAVKLLTKQKGYIMSEYIAGIRSDEMAFKVKAADRLDNMRSLSKADGAFIRKYVNETEEWFSDFSDEIKEEIKKAKETYKL